MLKLALDKQVKDVRESTRLTDSACCLVVGEDEMSLRMQKMLRDTGRRSGDSERILEVNPRHALIRSLAERARTGKAGREVEEMAHLLLDQALILEGEMPDDPALFVRRMSDAMAKAVAA